jgi:hypothetical protein
MNLRENVSPLILGIFKRESPGPNVEDPNCIPYGLETRSFYAFSLLNIPYLCAHSVEAPCWPCHHGPWSSELGSMVLVTKLSGAQRMAAFDTNPKELS